MIGPTDIVAFAEDWGRHPTSSQHLIRCLATDHRILYVNSLGLRRPRLNVHDATRAARKLIDVIRPASNNPSCENRSGSTLATATPSNLNVYAPAAISWPSSKLAFHLNRRLLKQQIRKQMAIRSIERPVLWTSLPSALPVVGNLDERALVYYCCDDFGSLVGVDHEPVMAMERKLVERADVVFATSEVLADRMPAAKTVLLPHGTDLAHFSQPAQRAHDLPASSKIAGFYGSIDARLNLDMLIAAANRLPDWEFVLIGPIRTDLSILTGHSNIHVLGPRSYNELPRYVQHWQVSMILYQVDEQIRAGNPLKMREYLAAGTPVATIRVPAVREYETVLSVCETPEGYPDAILAAANDSSRNGMRRQSVTNDSWQSRAKDISKTLASL